MCQFMRKREHLRGFGIGAVDENQRRQWIGKGEAAKLRSFESAVVVVSNDSVHHDENADFVGPPNEQP